MENKTESQRAPTGDSPGAFTLTYVLVTPARNEVENIERSIQAVIRQTVRPSRWVIVSDGSTDGTDDIVRKYGAEYDWIRLVRRPERAERHFAGKADCFNAGYSYLQDSKFDIIGNLDADLSFEADYFSFLLDKFAEDPALGLAGTPFKEGTDTYDYRFTSIEHVSGACQLFRRGCFEEIGGYPSLKVGGIDLVASITVRMNGWKTRTFTEKIAEHHRKTQSGKYSNRAAEFRSGYHDYLMGAHPVWQLFRCLYQSSRRPILIRGVLLLAGYGWALLKRAERPVSKEFIAFRKEEQMRRLKKVFSSLVSSSRRTAVRS
jgi:glycosyltransferase involved in cell wall biosynthesis